MSKYIQVNDNVVVRMVELPSIHNALMPDSVYTSNLYNIDVGEVIAEDDVFNIGHKIFFLKNLSYGVKEDIRVIPRRRVLGYYAGN